jgi:uncharacterized damage-inducible protein DinB
MVLVLFTVTQFAAADDMPSMASGFKADALANLNYVSKHVADLAGAMPAEKYSWRPGEGVRSVGEVYMHIAGANYFILKMAGVQTPEGMGASEDMDKEANDKTKVADALKQSLEFLTRSLSNTSDTDLEKKVTLFGHEMTMRGVYLLLISHYHEHLGQSIAYARINSVVPPWTAAQQKSSD